MLKVCKWISIFSLNTDDELKSVKRVHSFILKKILLKFLIIIFVMVFAYGHGLFPENIISNWKQFRTKNSSI